MPSTMIIPVERPLKPLGDIEAALVSNRLHGRRSMSAATSRTTDEVECCSAAHTRGFELVAELVHESRVEAALGEFQPFDQDRAPILASGAPNAIMSAIRLVLNDRRAATA